MFPRKTGLYLPFVVVVVVAGFSPPDNKLHCDELSAAPSDIHVLSCTCIHRQHMHTVITHVFCFSFLMHLALFLFVFVFLHFMFC